MEVWLSFEPRTLRAGGIRISAKVQEKAKDSGIVSAGGVKPAATAADLAAEEARRKQEADDKAKAAALKMK